MLAVCVRSQLRAGELLSETPPTIVCCVFYHPSSPHFFISPLLLIIFCINRKVQAQITSHDENATVHSEKYESNL